MLIHQIWLQGADAIPGPYRDYAASWRAMNSRFTHRIWTDAHISELLEAHYPQLSRLYRGYPYQIQRADVGRYALLHHYGGLYADMDSRCTRPIVGLLTEAASGERALLEGVHGVTIRVGMSIERLLSRAPRWPTDAVNNSFLYAPYPAHPLIDAIVQRLPRAATRHGLHLEHHISRTTGPLFLSRCLFDLWRDGVVTDYRVLPSAVIDGYRTHNTDVNWMREHPLYRRVVRSRLAWEKKQHAPHSGA
jgi:mannosyltransferase OCH1-like enzyme